MTDSNASGFHPLIAGWFQERFGSPTDVQERSWKAIMSGEHTLIAAPTGSGKTLAAMLPCLNGIMQQKEADAASAKGVKLLYITPLKALNNDIHHHVIGYILELERKAGSVGWKGLTAAVRTGDTTQSERAAMLRNPPDVLVTTPESLYLLLTSPKARMMLKTVRYCIVDEIHDLAAGSRGLHLSVSLERLTDWIGTTPQRIGVSATQKPIERIARYLGGFGNDGNDAGCRPRHVEIIESRMDKRFNISVTIAEKLLVTKDKRQAVWGPLTEHISKLIEGSRSVIIFVNNRRLCERLTLWLNDYVGYEMARTHHGSISREKRLAVEEALKNGELRCIVATSSLELGIDVGHIDLVLQIDSPKSAAAGIQRIGRAGHAVGDESRGVVVARSRGQLPECAVLARNIAARDIEEIRVPRFALDVLCQQVVAMVAAEDRTVPELERILHRSYGYNGFPQERLRAVLQVLAGYYPFVRPLLDWDRETDTLTKRSSTAMAAIMGAGTIPQGSAYPVHHADSRIHLGELDEEYIHESRAGDVFQLGTSSWRIQSIRNDRVYVVEETGNTFSEIPFWRGEGQGRSFGFSAEIGSFLAHLEQRIDQEKKHDTIEWLVRTHFLDAAAANELVMLIHSQKAVSELPTHRRIVIEQFQDEMKQHHLIIHSWFGRTFNRTWQQAIQLHAERQLPFRVYANAKDNGIEFIVSDGGTGEALRLLSLIREVTADRLEELLRQAIPTSPQFGIAFRRLAETSLLLARSFGRMPAWQKRLRSEELLKESLPYAGQFPFIGEAMRQCLYEELDVEGVRDALRKIESGDIEVVVKQAAYPSPFAALFLADFINAQMYESDTVDRDIQARLQGIDRTTAGRWFEGESVSAAWGGRNEEEDGCNRQAAAEGQAAEPVRTSAERAVEDPDKFVALLKRRGEHSDAELAEIVPGERLDELLSRLARSKKIVRVHMGRPPTAYWICADEADTYAELGRSPLANRFALSRYVDRRPSFTAERIRQRFGIDADDIAELMRQWEEEGRVEPAPGSATDGSGEGSAVWLSSRIAARQSRDEAQRLRQAANAVPPVRYCFRTMELQRVAPGTRLGGEEGLRQAIAALQGLFFPLSQWESSIFPLRVADYRKELLDRLCAAGEVLWIGRKQEDEKEGGVAFFLADNKELYLPILAQGDVASPSISTGEAPDEQTQGQEQEPLLELLNRKGASFLSALSRETGLIPSELTARLLELVWRGLVSNDQFAPLRLNGGARTGKASSGKGFQSGLGRWYAVRSLMDEAEYDRQASLAAWIKHLVSVYGLLTKDIAAQHLPWPWDDVYSALKQLELWGMLTRGLWVEDIRTLQFSTKEQVERLRVPGWGGDSQPVVLPSADPANPFGLIVHWPDAEGISFSRKKGNDLVVRGGAWLLWIENGGKRIYTMDRVADSGKGRPSVSMTPDELQSLLKSVASENLRISGARKFVVDKWNGKPVFETEAAGPLLKLGAEKDRDSLVLWPSAVR